MVPGVADTKGEREDVRVRRDPEFLLLQNAHMKNQRHSHLIKNRIELSWTISG